MEQSVRYSFEIFFILNISFILSTDRNASIFVDSIKCQGLTWAANVQKEPTAADFPELS